MVVRQTPANEILAAVGNDRLLGELDGAGVEDGLVPHDGHLRLVVTEGLHAEEQLVEDDAYAPDVDLQEEGRVRAAAGDLPWR